MISFGMPTLIELNTLEESAALCRELGLKFIELNMSFPQNQLEKLDVDELLRIREKYGTQEKFAKAMGFSDTSLTHRLAGKLDFKVTEVMKKDGSVTLVETASELPTFAAFARSLGVTQRRLLEWEEQYPAFASAAQKARDLQGDILIQNSLRGNYASSFAVFTAKNILGWSDGKEDAKPAEKTLVVKWEK